MPSIATNYWFRIIADSLIRCLACGKNTQLSLYRLILSCPHCGFAGQEVKAEE